MSSSGLDAARPVETIVTPPRRTPRPLPAGEVLSTEDYRRLFGVLEAVDRAPDLQAFHERLHEALRTWLGYGPVAVLSGPTLSAALLDGVGGGGVLSAYSTSFLDEYMHRWAHADPLFSAQAARLFATRDVLTYADLRADCSPEHLSFIEQFMGSAGIRDKAAVMIDAGPAGVLYIGAVAGGGPIPERDIALLRALRRHLTPLVADQFARQDSVAERQWQLTTREWEVARLAAQGLTNQQIARRLFVGVDTVKKHLTRVLAETGCASRTQLAVRWQQGGYLRNA